MEAGTTLRVLLIGASGVFGSRIARELANDSRFGLILAGRQQLSLTALRESLGDPSVTLAPLDVGASDLAALIASWAPQLVIHAAGPFQSQDYRVAEACLACGSDYVDLADGRDFVCGIDALHERACAAGRLLVSGASTVPALSSAVVDALLPRFGVLHVLFRAGLELTLLHFGTLGAAWLVRCGLIRDLPRHAHRLRRFSERFLRAGSDIGGTCRIRH